MMIAKRRNGRNGRNSVLAMAASAIAFLFTAFHMQGIFRVLKVEEGDGRDRTIGELQDSVSFRYHRDAEINSRLFYLLDLSEEKSPRYCRMAFQDLSWTVDSTYADLLSECRAKGESTTIIFQDTSNPKTKIFIAHQVPKTGSSTVRDAVSTYSRQHCPGRLTKVPIQTCDIIPGLLTNCSEHKSFFHLTARIPPNSPGPCFDYQDDYPLVYQQYQFVHSVAFRNFRSWAASALNQVIKEKVEGGPATLDKMCNRLRNMFAPDTCKRGGLELHYDGYSKSILRSVLKETPEQDPIVLHDYLDTSYMMADFLVQQLDHEPFPIGKKSNTRHSSVTCPDSNDILDQYHACFDDLLVRGGKNY